MPNLYFQCPSTGRDIPSCIQTDDASVKLVAQLPVTLPCSCGQTHHMRMCDGRFVATPIAARKRPDATH